MALHEEHALNNELITFKTKAEETTSRDLLRLITEKCAPSVESPDTTLPSPTEILVKAHKAKPRTTPAPPVSDPDKEIPGSKYNHILPDCWFTKNQPTDLRKLFSASVATTTASLYSRHINNWITFCAGVNADHSNPDSDLILAFLSKTIQAHGASPAQTCEAALRKFAAINSIELSCFHDTAIKCLI